MFRPNRLKRLLAEKHPARGAWLFMGSPVVTEAMAPMGFDALIIDHEHSPGGLETAIHQMRAMAGTDTTMLARLSDNNPTPIRHLLDAGVEGVMAANLDSADAADRLVRATRYPPHGIRGAHYTVSRASGWGAWSVDVAERGEAETLAIGLIESVEGVDAIAEMARVPGLDMLFIGPLDLSISAGVPGQYDAPAFRDILQAAERRILEAGLALGGTILPGLPAAAMFARGYGFVTVGADVTFLRRGATLALDG
ncbi:HpcH/HpaI aldolase family protein [Niveispirillum sp. KHB5.9]|uniref:HpcH/HpaI aldolase family protein n=1 Tax=Niveispirillum sp. KHB5.9 TaxID=3400269 RepID=UPI003A86212B